MEHTISLKKNFEFKRVYAKGKSRVSPAVVVYARKNRGGENRLGITVSVKVGKAVVRNRIRRRLHEIYRLHEHTLISGYDIILVARVRAAFASYSQLESAVLSSLKALGLMAEK